MKSCVLEIEPLAAPRLAAAALLLHLAAAASPWLARTTPILATVLSLLAIAGFALTLRRLPGRHCVLAALSIDTHGCRVRLRGQRDFLAAELGPGSRAYPWLVFADIRAGSRRLGWLLPRESLPHGSFRRLKARIRFSC